MVHSSRQKRTQKAKHAYMRSFQNRHIYPLKGCTVSTHRLSCPARPAPRPPHDKLVHSFQNRQIYPLEGFIVSTHKLSCPPRPPSPPPPPFPFDRNQAPTSFKNTPSPHRLFDLQVSLDKLMHFLPQLSDFVPLRNGFYSFRAQTKITLLTLIATL